MQRPTRRESILSPILRDDRLESESSFEIATGSPRPEASQLRVVLNRSGTGGSEHGKIRNFVNEPDNSFFILRGSSRNPRNPKLASNDRPDSIGRPLAMRINSLGYRKQVSGSSSVLMGSIFLSANRKSSSVFSQSCPRYAEVRPTTRRRKLCYRAGNFRLYERRPFRVRWKSCGSNDRT